MSNSEGGNGYIGWSQLKEITLSETVTLLKQLGNSFAFGHDRLDSLTFKLVATSLFVPLNHLINLSIRRESLLEMEDQEDCTAPQRLGIRCYHPGTFFSSESDVSDLQSNNKLCNTWRVHYN